MPRSNGTGPLGQGPRTGRGMGRCGGGNSNRFFAGRRGCWRMGSSYSRPAVTAKEEKEILSEEINILEKELKDMKARLSDIKN